MAFIILVLFVRPNHYLLDFLVVVLIYFAVAVLSWWEVLALSL